MHLDRRAHLGLLLAAAVVLLSFGCAANPAKQAADRAACDKLLAAVKTAFESGAAPLDPETAAFASARGLQDNLVRDATGGGYTFVPRNLPFPLLAAVDPKEGGPRYRAAVASLTREYVQQLAEEGRRCQW